MDKTDIYGLARRNELRTYLRGLSDSERRAIGANAENLDPEMALAIREMPAALSGMLETDHARLVDHALRLHHGDAVNEITEVEEAIKIAEGALSWRVKKWERMWAVCRSSPKRRRPTRRRSVCYG